MSDSRVFRVRIANVRLKSIAASSEGDPGGRRAAVYSFVADYIARHGRVPKIADVQKMHVDRFGSELPKTSAWRLCRAALALIPVSVKASPRTGLSHRPPNVPKTSRFKGVHYDRARPWAPWHARIMIRSERQHLGFFATEEAAAHAYDHAATMAVGDEALTNARLGLFAIETRRGPSGASEGPRERAERETHRNRNQLSYEVTVR